MPLHRHFLNWNAPVTQRVQEFLLPAVPSTQHQEPSTPALTPSPAHPAASYALLLGINLRDTLIVVPTRQAARHLSETLVRHAATQNLALLGARIVPPTFFLQADPPDSRIASATTAAATWAAILLALRPDDAPTLFPPATRRADFEWALQSGQMLQRLRQTLSDGAYRITDVIARFGDRLEERDRWNDLATLESRYLAALDRLNLLDPITARIALATNGNLDTEIKRIVIASVLDPSLLVITALQAAALRIPVDILIHAPASLAASFDDWGRPLPDAWRDREIPIPDPDRRIFLEATPLAQSTRAVHLLKTLPPRAAVGVPDPTVTPFLAAACADAGLTAFDPADKFLSLHPLTTLIDAIATLCTDRSYTALSTFLHHADALECLSASPRQLLTELDKFQNEFLPANLDAVTDALARCASESPDPYPTLRAAITSLSRSPIFNLQSSILNPPSPSSAHSAPPREILPSVSTALRTFLKAIYATRRLDPHNEDDTEFETAAQEIDTALRELEDAPDGTLPSNPLHQLALLRQRLTDARYHPVAHRAAYDLEGWLELPWNNSPNLIVTGMNEGSVPDTQLRDPFLPDSLCTLLGLRHDAARLARDACLMTALIASRAPHGTAMFIAGKFSPTGDPLKPSRLLFRCADAELAPRAARLFGPAEAHRTSVPSSISFQLNSAMPSSALRSATAAAPSTQHQAPSTPTPAPISRLSVTAFRAYLACPFRFYLQNVLRMEPLDDNLAGLDARNFGTLSHEVLQAMATSGMWRCDDVHALRSYLHSAVDTWIHHRFGPRPPVVVTLAAEAAKQRLGAAAQHQITLAADGWEIIRTETKCTARLGSVEIVGKIDRIDRHRHTGHWRIIDYKTSDTPVAPAAAHLASVRDDTPDWQILHTGGRSAATPRDSDQQILKAEKPRRWIDLQLPLYIWLLRNGTITDPSNELSSAAVSASVAPPPRTQNPDLSAVALAKAEPRTPHPLPPTDWRHVELGYFNLPKAVADTQLTLWENLDEPTLAAAATCATEAIHRITANTFWPPADRVPHDPFESLLLGDPSATILPPFPGVPR